ncbi:MAG TPA: hypothetical protein VEI82_03850 [Myxococcota bacterium]|nr:hypothetical protein [Myxococcota bacterium]
MSAPALVFLATVAGVALAALAAARRAAPRWSAAAAVALCAWLGFVAALAASGWLAGFDARPPHFFVLMVPTAAVTLWLALSRVGDRVAARVGWAGLIGFQVFRLPVEWVLLELARAGIAPPQMTLAGANWDVLTGASAPLVAWLAARGLIGSRVLGLWNVAGLALLANVVAIAVLSAPTPLRAFANEPANTFVALWPWCWLPGFLVPAAFFGHVVALRKLGRVG